MKILKNTLWKIRARPVWGHLVRNNKLEHMYVQYSI